MAGFDYQDFPISNISLKPLPLGQHDFTKLRANNEFYIDKTDLIAEIAKIRKPVFFSRPRRFGKSLLVSTFKSLFSRGLTDFHGLAIEKVWSDKTYRVIHLDFSSLANVQTKDFKIHFNRLILAAFNIKETSDPLDKFGSPLDPGELLRIFLHRLSKSSIVLLIDEYDAPIVQRLGKPAELYEISCILKDFYTAIEKDKSRFRFIFITGVTKFTESAIFSVFSNLQDLSLDIKYHGLLGFNTYDVLRTLRPYVEKASKVLKISVGVINRLISYYYGGFNFSLYKPDDNICNPWSILNFLHDPEQGFRSYWFQDSPRLLFFKEYLKVKNDFDFIDYNDRDIKIKRSELQSYFSITNIPDRILLFNEGYFRQYFGPSLENPRENAELNIVNHEISEELLRLYLSVNNLKPNIEIENAVANLVKYIDEHDILGIFELVNLILKNVATNKTVFRDSRSLNDIIFATISLAAQKFYTDKEFKILQIVGEVNFLTPKTDFYLECLFFRPENFQAEYYTQRPLAEAISKIDLGETKDWKYLAKAEEYRLVMSISPYEKILLPEYSVLLF